MVAPAANHTTSNGDGSVGIAELNLVLAAFGKSIGDTDYKVEADFNADGAINLQDLNIQIAQSGKSIERGRLSASGNIVGYAGYIFEPATGMYVVRHRWYSTENGRWLSRDPLEYVDGSNMHQYAKSQPAQFTDPLGLRSCAVQFRCELVTTNDLNNRTECVYSCTSTGLTKKMNAAATVCEEDYLDCDDLRMKALFNREIGKNLVFVFTELRRWTKCKESITSYRVIAGRNCNKIGNFKCTVASCNKRCSEVGVFETEACARIRDPRARLSCMAAAEAFAAACTTFCETFCSNVIEVVNSTHACATPSNRRN